jgi:SAM-dependent methyltransferase
MRQPEVHLCIVQPVGDVSPLGFLDQARFFRYQFRRLGAEVSIGKNRLRHDAVNFVFGAHLGFDPALRERHTCVFVNLEQLGDGGKPVSAAYLDLIATSAVVDYEASNLAAYAASGIKVPIVSFAEAPYLAQPAGLALEKRPIDILFFGAVNERRRRLIAQIEAAGRTVAAPRGLIFGPERDGLIAQAKVVFNCHYYETARFEQARVFHCLSMGTPVVSERAPSTAPPVQFEDSVFWVPTDEVGSFFADRFGAPGFADECRAKLASFSRHDVLDQYAQALASGLQEHGERAARMAPGPWRPLRLHIGSGKDYKPGWFNVDILASAQPDAVVDLAQPLSWPLRLSSELAGDVELQPGSLDCIFANNVLEHVPDLPTLMGNCLTLLRTGGELQIEVPYERATTAWQDPTHVRALNENSWIYYAEWFWYLGWFEARFQVQELGYLDGRLQPCDKDAAHYMRVRLVKVATTLVERTMARTMRADFGGLPDDLQPFAPAAATAPDRALEHAQ